MHSGLSAIQTQMHALNDQTRTEMVREMVRLNDETRARMRALHEDVIARIALLHEGLSPDTG